MTVSMLEGRHGHQAKEFAKLVDWLRSVPPPDVVMLPNVLLSGFAAPIKRAIGRPVVCTMQGEDLFLEGLGAEHRRAALGLVRQHAESVDAFVAVSEFYARSMPDYLGIPAGKVRVVPLGINPDGFAPAVERRARPFTVGYMARVAPEKGLHLLAEAYRMMREGGVPAEARLEVAGYLSAEFRPYLADVERKMGEWGLAAEFRYHGVVDRAGKIAFLQGLDVLSVPATYDEPKGLSLFEAMACGVPVVEPRRGAFPEIIERTGGGVLVEKDDPAALAAGLAALAADPARARELGRRGREGVLAHYHVSVMADRTLDVLGEVGRR
jgi:glycosyltransferase involved in cell wall biosynthesis